ncbi:hypothetical protein [Mesorhizobium sp. M0910]|uniref:hypothetical protein n=1 Tax=Mesorhizobium sp. M0910 TaxID=2957025 RepID=UPI003334D62B
MQDIHSAAPSAQLAQFLKFLVARQQKLLAAVVRKRSRTCETLGQRTPMDERRPSAANGEAKVRDVDLWENASRNALNRLVRCLFAERLLESDGLLWACDSNQAWLPLWQSRRVLHFTDLHAAPAGTLQNRGRIEVLEGTGTRQLIDDASDLITQVAPDLATSPASTAWRIFAAALITASATTSWRVATGSAGALHCEEK